METENIGSLPILDGEQLAGMVTDRDIVIRAVAKGKDPRGMQVREVASGELVTVQANDDLAEALRLMASQQVRRLRVVDENNMLVGILAQADIAGTLHFEPVPGGTRMRWAWVVRPKGASRLLTPVIGRLGRRQERAIWTGMKRYLEAQPQPGRDNLWHPHRHRPGPAGPPTGS